MQHRLALQAVRHVLWLRGAEKILASAATSSGRHASTLMLLATIALA